MAAYGCLWPPLVPMANGAAFGLSEPPTYSYPINVYPPPRSKHRRCLRAMGWRDCNFFLGGFKQFLDQGGVRTAKGKMFKSLHLKPPMGYIWANNKGDTGRYLWRKKLDSEISRNISPCFEGFSLNFSPRGGGGLYQFSKFSLRFQHKNKFFFGPPEKNSQNISSAKFFSAKLLSSKIFPLVNPPNK
jgi:hypothetical protein